MRSPLDNFLIKYVNDRTVALLGRDFETEEAREIDRCKKVLESDLDDQQKIRYKEHYYLTWELRRVMLMYGYIRGLLSVLEPAESYELEELKSYTSAKEIHQKSLEDFANSLPCHLQVCFRHHETLVLNCTSKQVKECMEAGRKDFNELLLYLNRPEHR